MKSAIVSCMIASYALDQCFSTLETLRYVDILEFPSQNCWLKNSESWKSTYFRISKVQKYCSRSTNLFTDITECNILLSVLNKHDKLSKSVFLPSFL